MSSMNHDLTSETSVQITTQIRNASFILSFMPNILEVTCKACKDGYTMKAYDIAGAYDLLKQHIALYHQNAMAVIPTENEYLHRKSRRGYSEK